MPVKVTAREKRDYSEVPIEWMETNDAEYPFRAFCDGEELVLRLNDFPDEPLYTVIIDGDEQGDYEEWSPLWSRYKSL